MDAIQPPPPPCAVEPPCVLGCRSFILDPTQFDVACFCGHLEEEHRHAEVSVAPLIVLEPRECQDGRSTFTSGVVSYTARCENCSLPYIAHSPRRPRSLNRTIPNSAISSVSATPQQLFGSARSTPAPRPAPSASTRTAAAVEPVPTTTLPPQGQTANMPIFGTVTPEASSSSSSSILPWSFNSPDEGQTTNGRRVASYQRHPGSRGPHSREGSRRTVSVSTGNGVAVNPFTGQLPTVALPQLNQPSSSTSQQPRAGRGSSQSVPQTRFTIVLHTEPHPDSLRTESDNLFRNLYSPCVTKMPSFIERAKSLNLAFDLDLDLQPHEPVNQHIYEGINTHFMRHQFFFGKYMGSTQPLQPIVVPDPSPDTQRWALSLPRRASKRGNKRSRLHLEISPTFSLSDLRTATARSASYYSPVNPQRPEGLQVERRVVFIQPQFCVVMGPFENNGIHTCHGKRLWDGFYTAEHDEPSTNPQCNRSCHELSSLPNVNLGDASGVSEPAIDQVPSQDEVTVHQVHTVDTRASPVPEPAAPAARPAPPSASQPPRASRMMSAMTFQSEHITAALEEWRGEVRQYVAEIEEVEGMAITSDTPANAAEALWGRITNAMFPEINVPTPPANTTITRFSLDHLLSLDNRYIIGDGVGTGVIRAVWRSLIQLMTSKSKYWIGIHDDYFTPNLFHEDDVSPTDIFHFWVCGKIIQLALLLGFDIAPISPVVILYVLHGFSISTDMSFIKAVAPDAHKRLTSWPPQQEYTAQGDPLPLDLSLSRDPMLLIINYMPNYTRDHVIGMTPEAQEKLGVRLKGHLLFEATGLDQPSARMHALLAGLKEGLNFWEASQTSRPEFLAMFGSPEKSAQILAGLYSGRKITSAAQVLQYISYRRNSTVRPELAALQDTWIASFERFLRGANELESLMRCKFFVRTLTGYEWLPDEERGGIVVQFMTERRFDERGLRAGHYSHVCSQTLDVLLIDGADYLAPTPPNTEETTSFDHWMNGVISLADGPGSFDDRFNIL